MTLCRPSPLECHVIFEWPLTSKCTFVSQSSFLLSLTQASSSPQTSFDKVSEGQQKKGHTKSKADLKVSQKKIEDWEEEVDPDLDVSENRESAKPVLVKSVSYPFLCERVSSRNEDESGNHFESRPKSFMDELWNDFLNAPETNIGGSEDEEEEAL